MGYCANETLGYKEEERHISALTTMVRDALKPKIIGGGRQEDKEGVDDHNITPPAPHHR